VQCVGFVVVLRLVFTVGLPSQEIDWEDRLRTDLYIVSGGMQKPQPNQSKVHVPIETRPQLQAVPQIYTPKPGSSIVSFNCTNKSWGFFSRIYHLPRGGSRSRDWRGPYGECGAPVYNGGLGAVPQRVPEAEPLVRGSGGEAP